MLQVQVNKKAHFLKKDPYKAVPHEGHKILNSSYLLLSQH